MTVEVELARSFARDTAERYTDHFVALLLEQIQWPSHPTRALEIECGTGFATLPVHAKLPDESLVVAISEQRYALRQLHEQLTPQLRERIFPRKEAIGRLPFAKNTFDLIWSCLPTTVLPNPRRFLLKALSVLRPGGQFVLCVPLKGSFLELIGPLTQAASLGDDPRLLNALVSERPELLDMAGWRSLLQKLGAIEITEHSKDLALTITPPASEDRLFGEHLLPVWLGREAGDPQALPLLDAGITEPLTVHVKIGCISAHRGMAELEDATA